MEHIGTIIWLIVIVLGGISTIVRSARRSAQSRAAGTQPFAQQAAPSSLPVRVSHQPVVAGNASSVVVQATPYAQVVVPVPQASEAPAPPALAPQPVAPPPAAAALAPLPALPHDLPQRRRGQISLQFEERGTWVRALIASEVLGPPISLREQRFWNQPHNEASI